MNIVTDDEEFTLNSSAFTFLRFRTTLDKFFTCQFIELLKTETKNDDFLIKSLEPLNEITGISVTIDGEEGKMLLALSKSIDQSTGLDASKLLVDSAKFDSSTSLLEFNLFELLGQKKRLQRIQGNSAKVLARPEYSCDFVAVFQATGKPAEFIQKLSTLLGTTVAIDDSLRPKLTQQIVKNLPWPLKDEINLMNRPETLEIFDWIGYTLNPDYNYKADSEDFFSLDSCKFVSLTGPLLPPKLIYEALNHLTESSTRLVASLKCCQGIPPSFGLNLERLKHFNEKKFDPTACTADQSALALLKTPLQSVIFRLNIAT